MEYPQGSIEKMTKEDLIRMYQNGFENMRWREKINSLPDPAIDLICKLIQVSIEFTT